MNLNIISIYPVPINLKNSGSKFGTIERQINQTNCFVPCCNYAYLTMVSIMEYLLQTSRKNYLLQYRRGEIEDDMHVISPCLTLGSRKERIEMALMDVFEEYTNRDKR